MSNIPHTTSCGMVLSQANEEYAAIIPLHEKKSLSIIKSCIIGSLTVATQ